MAVSDTLLQEFSDFVATRIGLHFPRERWSDLLRGMVSLAHECNFSGPEPCMRKLMAAPLTRHEVEMLASHLSVGETYFFREPAMFATLEQEVLPQLINARRAGGKRLRIWSAGCCTGEEAYSMAILISRLLPDLADWNITILGTDINPRFLDKAAHGVYRDWSFRGVPPWIKLRYFDNPEPGSYAILPQIKRLVSFEHLNLASDPYPALENNSNAMDIILCRNVLMYFEPPKIRQVAQKLHRSLVDGGWLVVSPAETNQELFSRFAAVNFPDVTLFRKDGDRRPPPPQPADAAEWITPVCPVFDTALSELEAELADSGASEQSRSPIMDEPSAALPVAPYQTALACYEQGAYEQAIAVLAATDQPTPPGLALLARAHANLGQLTEAGHWCEAAIAVEKCDPGLRYLLAVILEEQDRIDEALGSLKRALYLNQGFVLAHFGLGSLYRRQRKPGAAARHFNHALDLLHAYPSDAVLPESEGLTAGRLIEIIHAKERLA